MRRRFWLIAMLLPTPAFASDWYTGARQTAPGDDWIVAVDTSVDVTTQASYFGDVAVTGALNGNLTESGPRARIDGLGGRYQYYANDLGTTVHGTQASGAALVGYAWVSPIFTFAAYLGADVRNNTLSVYDPQNPVNGTTFGAKGQLELFARPTPMTIIAANASFATNYTAYFVRLRAGYRIGPDLYIGPEAAALGDAFFNQERIGAHLTGLQAGPVQLAFAAGYLYDRVRGSGGYGTIDARLGF